MCLSLAAVEEASLLHIKAAFREQLAELQIGG